MITRSYINNIIKVKEISAVTLLQAKEQLNVEEDFLEDDEHILLLIESATGACEDIAGIDIALTSNTLEYIRPNLNSTTIFESPFHSITSITVTTDDVDTIITSSEYEVQVRKTDFTIMFNDNIDVDKLVIVFQTGWARDESPHPLTSAILVKINDLYDVERTTYTSGANFKDNETVNRLLSGHIISRW